MYQRYGNAIADGEVPYRDFSVEYPPGALPVFALPGLAEPGHDQNVTTGFRHAFETLMWLCGAGALLAMAFALSSLGSGELRVWGALSFAAVAPLGVELAVEALDERERLPAERVDLYANCASSVEPWSASVDESFDTACITWSKYPAPTSRWCFVAV